MIGRREHDDAQAFDRAWSGAAPRDHDVAELVRYAEMLCEAASVVEPGSAFRSSLRTRLMAEAAEVLVPMPSDGLAVVTEPTRAGRRRVATIASAAVASLGVVGMVSSSASAMPGDMLYSVKRGVENVELALHRDDASRGQFQLERATERLEEARHLSADGTPRSEELLAETLDDFAVQADDGSTALFSDFDASGSETSISDVNDFAASATAELGALSTVIPASADDAFQLAARTVTDVATQASSLCATCSPADVDSLLDAIDTVTTANAATQSTSSDTTSDDDAPAPAKTAAAAPTTAAPTTPVVAAPKPTTPVATSSTPRLSDVTDPVVGLLLDDEKGLVPGLLDTLLGRK